MSFSPSRYRKPTGNATISRELQAKALSVYALTNDIDTARDAKGRTTLTHGAGAARPVFAKGVAGLGLIYDGSNDESWGSLPSSIIMPYWVAGGGTLGSDVTTVRTLIGLGSTAASFGAFVTISVEAGVIRARVRRVDAAGVVNINGPTAVAGMTYHCAYSLRTGSGHALWVNGIRYTSASGTGASDTNLDRASLGCLRRGSTGDFWQGTVYWGAFGVAEPGEKFLRELSVNPWRHIFSVPKAAPAMWSQAAATGWGPLLGFGRNSLVVNA